MLIVAGEIESDPAQREAAVAAAREVMEARRARPAVAATSSAPTSRTPGRFRIFEEWESQAALDAHFTTPHMAAFQARVARLGVKGMQIQKYQVASVGPLR